MSGEDRKRHFYATADFWRSQALGLLVGYKYEWSGYGDLVGLLGECAFCHYYSCSFIGTIYECPLGGLNNMTKACAGKNYIKWQRTENPPYKRIEGAKGVFNLILAYMKKNYPEYLIERGIIA